MTLLLFQSNLYLVLVHEKGPKNSIHRYLFKTKKNPKQNPPDPSCVLHASLTDFPKCLKMASSQNF